MVLHYFESLALVRMAYKKVPFSPGWPAGRSAVFVIRRRHAFRRVLISLKDLLVAEVLRLANVVIHSEV